jgi:hypothetical protein
MCGRAYRAAVPLHLAGLEVGRDGPGQLAGVISDRRPAGRGARGDVYDEAGDAAMQRPR